MSQIQSSGAPAGDRPHGETVGGTIDIVKTETGSTGIEKTGAATAHSELALTNDIYTVGEVFDPLTGNSTDLHGIMIEFDETQPLIDAVNRAYDAGYRKLDCYSPIPVEGLTDAMRFKDKKIPALMFLGGLTGCTLAFLLQMSGMAWFYPVNIGGKPLFSWPQYIVPCFEMTILFTALTGVFSMIVLNGLPTLYHPVFNVPGFEAASSDRFFLCLESEDAHFDRTETLQFARTLGGLRVAEVAR